MVNYLYLFLVSAGQGSGGSAGVDVAGGNTEVDVSGGRKLTAVVVAKQSVGGVGSGEKGAGNQPVQVPSKSDTG